MSAPRIRVLIADDHQLVRSGLRGLLEREGEFQVVAEAADGYEAIELASAHRPDIVLLDVGMPRLSGTDAAQRLSEKFPASRIIILSMHSDEAYVLKALKAGARGYLLKASPEADVLAAVRAVAAGNAYFSPSITKLLVEDYVSELRRNSAAAGQRQEQSRNLGIAAHQRDYDGKPPEQYSAEAAPSQSGGTDPLCGEKRTDLYVIGYVNRQRQFK